MFTKYKEFRRLDPEKGVNKLFENVLCKWRIQNFFSGVEGEHIPAELLQGKSINKNSFKRVGGECYPKKF